MKILYISTVNSNKKYNILFEKSNGRLRHSIQKFHQLIISGLKENNNDITVLSGLQISNKSINKKIFLAEKEIENDIKYLYPFLLNIPILKQLFTIISFVCYFIWWIIKNKGDDKRVIIESAYISIAPIMVFLCKLFNVKSVCIVADIYNYMTLNVNVNDKRSFFEKISCKICKYCWRNYDYFILLTEEMNKVINPLNKPHIVMEGLVDSKFETKGKNCKKKKAIMYAGGLAEIYGVKLLIDSFIKWNNPDYELWLCGNGELVDYIKSIKNKKVKYFGILPNNDVIKLEKEATLLVNPRFSNEEYTKFSFPSKNMEYMLSGTAVLTTKLPGMPDDYKKYVYLVENETISGYVNTFNNLLLNKTDNLNEKGLKAQQFVLKEKNNIMQAQKITKFIKKKNNSNVNNNKIINKLMNLYLFINIILLLLSSLNIFGLYSVSKYAYGLYILNIIFTIIGLKFKRKKSKKESYHIDFNQDKEIKFFRSNIFKYFLVFTFCCVLIYFIKYLYIIKDLPTNEIRMAAFTKLHSNAFDAVFYIYIVTNCVRIIELLLPIFIFDKNVKSLISKKTIFFMFLITLVYTFIGFSRMSLLFLVILSILSIIYFCDIKNFFSKKNIVKCSLILLSIFIVSCLMIFVRMNSIKNFSSFLNSIIIQIEQIFIYFLGSFRTLDHFLTNGFSNLHNLHFGRATFAGFDEIILYPIKFFGSEILSFNQIISPHTQTAISVSENVNYYNAFFTSVMNFYLDFKVFGVIIFSFLHGIFINYITGIYLRHKTIFSKCCLLFVSYNLLISSLKWEYQSGNTVFLIIVLIVIDYLFLIKKGGRIR